MQNYRRQQGVYIVILLFICPDSLSHGHQIRLYSDHERLSKSLKQKNMSMIFPTSEVTVKASESIKNIKRKYVSVFCNKRQRSHSESDSKEEIIICHIAIDHGQLSPATYICIHLFRCFSRRARKQRPLYGTQVLLPLVYSAPTRQIQSKKIFKSKIFLLAPMRMTAELSSSVKSTHWP